MRWIGRLLLIGFALPVAIVAGTLTLFLVTLFDPVLAAFAGTVLRAGLTALLDSLAAAGDPGFAIESTAVGLGRLALTVLVAPPVFVALVSEVIGARRFLWHAGATGLLTGALPWLARSGVARTPEETHIALLLALTGAVAGAVYWLIAGSSAGTAQRTDDRLREGATLPSRS
jgi:hypothetical protein